MRNTCKRAIPLWLILIDNIPTIFMYALGTIIVWHFALWAGIVFLVYNLSTLVWFWSRICTACPHYANRGCPCGYGIISSKLFKKNDVLEFKKAFNTNIIYLFPAWFVPPAISAYLLVSILSVELLIISIIFCIDGFLIIPLISKLVACKQCELKESCPWMQKERVAAKHVGENPIAAFTIVLDKSEQPQR